MFLFIFCFLELLNFIAFKSPLTPHLSLKCEINSRDSASVSIVFNDYGGVVQKKY